METTFEILQNYIRKYWSCSVTEVNLNASLDDLGMFGDDKIDFLNDYSKTFNVDLSGFDFNKYIESEPDMSLLIDNISQFLLKNRFTTKFDKEVITVSMLVEGINNGRIGSIL